MASIVLFPLSLQCNWQKQNNNNVMGIGKSSHKGKKFALCKPILYAFWAEAAASIS